MKDSLIPVFLILFSCVWMSSCIEEEFDVSSEQTARIQLSLSMNTTYSSTKALDTEEAGTEYENTIVGTSDIHIFIFDTNDDSYIGEVTRMTFYENNHAPIKYVEGELPKGTLNKNIRLVFMANYASRNATPAPPPSGVNYTHWKKGLIFSYGNHIWTEENAAQGEYIPMSGECIFTVRENNSEKINLVRAVAKIRLRMKEGCPYYITSLKTENATSKGFSLQQDNSHFTVPPYSDGLYFQLNLPQLQITGDHYFEYYIPEQITQDETSLQIGLNDGTLSADIPFKYYPHGDPYNIERNYIYEFVVNKKKDESKTDVEVHIKEWLIHSINTDYD